MLVTTLYNNLPYFKCTFEQEKWIKLYNIRDELLWELNNLKEMFVGDHFIVIKLNIKNKHCYFIISGNKIIIMTTKKQISGVQDGSIVNGTQLFYVFIDELDLYPEPIQYVIDGTDKPSWLISIEKFHPLTLTNSNSNSNHIDIVFI